jgi:hypothetical protein
MNSANFNFIGIEYIFDYEVLKKNSLNLNTSGTILEAFQKKKHCGYVFSNKGNSFYFSGENEPAVVEKLSLKILYNMGNTPKEYIYIGGASLYDPATRLSDDDVIVVKMTHFRDSKNQNMSNDNISKVTEELKNLYKINSIQQQTEQQTETTTNDIETPIINNIVREECERKMAWAKYVLGNYKFNELHKADIEKIIKEREALSPTLKAKANAADKQFMSFNKYQRNILQKEPMIGTGLEREAIQNNASNVVNKNNKKELRICWAKHVLGNKYNSHKAEIEEIIHSNRPYHLSFTLQEKAAKLGKQFIKFRDYQNIMTKTEF